MKRDIKFRVWNGAKQKFSPLEGSVISLDDKNNTASLRPINSDNCIQQSLNLYDIDGKEIFEGDIVDLYAKKDSSYKPKAIHQASLRWMSSHACFGLYQYKDGQEIPIYKIDTRKLRILGNVLENKEQKK